MSAVTSVTGEKIYLTETAARDRHGGKVRPDGEEFGGISLTFFRPPHAGAVQTRELTNAYPNNGGIKGGESNVINLALTHRELPHSDPSGARRHLP